MISLEQIRLLEDRIGKAIERIELLKGENQTLRHTLDSSQQRLAELEKLVEQFKTDQEEIEEAILRAIQNLERLENDIAESPAGAKEKAASRKKNATQAAEDSRSLPFEAEAPGDQPRKDLDIF